MDNMRMNGEIHMFAMFMIRWRVRDASQSARVISDSPISWFLMRKMSLEFFLNVILVQK